MWFIPVIQSWIFSITGVVFSVTRSFRNRSNMLICCSRSIYDYYRCWKLFLWKLIIHNCILLGIIWFYIYSLGSSSLSFILCTCSFRCKNLLTKGQRWSVVVKLHRFMSSYLGLFSFGPATEMFWFQRSYVEVEIYGVFSGRWRYLEIRAPDIWCWFFWPICLADFLSFFFFHLIKSQVIRSKVIHKIA